MDSAHSHGVEYICMSCREKDKRVSRQCKCCGEYFSIVPMRPAQEEKFVDAAALLKNIPDGEEVSGFEFLGRLPRTFSFVMYGDPGAGKSRVSLLLAHRLPGKTLYVSSEQDLLSGAFRKMVEFVSERAGTTNDKLHFANAYSRESLLRKCAGYDNVILDSLTALNSVIPKKSDRFQLSDLRELRSQMNVFGYLLHSTKKKGYQGETWLTHEPDLVMRVKKFSIVQVTKNRFDEAQTKKVFQ